MRLEWPAFEKQSRKLVREELKRSPALRKEFKKGRKANANLPGRLLGKVGLPLLWILIPANMMMKQGFPTALAIISLWFAGSCFLRGHRWFQHFYASRDLVVLNLLPLNDEQVFQVQKRNYFKSSLWLIWELLAAYCIVGLFWEESRSVYYLLPFAALLQAMLVMALGLHLANWLHFLPLGAIGGFLRVSAVALLIWALNQPENSNGIVQVSSYIFPTGWLNYALYLGGVKHDWFSLALLIPIVALIVASRFAWARLRAFYSLEGFEVIPSLNNAPEEPELTPESFDRKPGPTEIEDNIGARNFLKGVNWQATGWLERFVAGLFSKREMEIAEFLVAQNPGWTKAFNVGLVIWLMVCLVVWTLGSYNFTIVYMCAYLLGTATLPIFGGHWRGLRQMATGGVFIPAFAVYPIAFNEVARVLLKVNVTRILAASPFLITFGALASYKLNASPLLGAEIALQILEVLILVQPVFVLLPISTTSSKLRFGYSMVFLLLILMLAGAMISLFFVQGIMTRAIINAGLVLLAILIYLLYRKAYRFCKMDLINLRAPDQE